MTRQARYQSAYRLRSAVRGEILAQGWAELDTLLVFQKDDGEVVIVTKDGERLSIEGVETHAAPTLVQSLDVPSDEFGPRWNAAREKFGKALADLDLSEKGHKAALATFEQVAAAVLRGVEVLRDSDGPEWREEIGLTS